MDNEAPKQQKRRLENLALIGASKQHMALFEQFKNDKSLKQSYDKYFSIKQQQKVFELQIEAKYENKAIPHDDLVAMKNIPREWDNPVMFFKNGKSMDAPATSVEFGEQQTLLDDGQIALQALQRQKDTVLETLVPSPNAKDDKATRLRQAMWEEYVGSKNRELEKAPYIIRPIVEPEPIKLPRTIPDKIPKIIEPVQR